MTSDFETGVAYADQRDEEDPLSRFRDRFAVSGDERYMDGNSLGVLSTDAERTLSRVVEEWREQGIRGWTDADLPWFWYGEHLGDRLAPLLGASEDEVVVANSTTVNIHTLIGTFYDRADGEKIVVNELDFPTDHYAIQGQLRAKGVDPDDALTVVESRDGRTIAEDDVIAALDDDVGIVFMPSVLYRSGQLLDLADLTHAAHDQNALVGFDLAHSVGVVPHDLSALGVDFAVWCSYKYLNAGPGAIAGLYVNERHFGAQPGLPGWWGHEKETQFDMNQTFTPEQSAGAWQTGTIPMLSAAPLEGSLDIIEEAGINAIREKSIDLTDYLIHLADELLTDIEDVPDCAVGTPCDPSRRGGHVAIEHEDAYRISLALCERGDVVDFRPPNVVRVCPSPLYVRYRDVWQTIQDLREIIEDRTYEQFELEGNDMT